MLAGTGLNTFVIEHKTLTMNFLKKTTTWTNGRLWIFKWGVFTAGILIGCYLGPYLQPYMSLLWLMSIVCCLLAAYFWISGRTH